MAVLIFYRSAHFNRADIQIESTRNHLDMASAKKPSHLFGYEQHKVENGVIADISSKQQAVITTVFRLFLDDRLTLNGIAERLNNDPVSLTALSSEKGEHRFYATTIEKILRRPEYAGVQRDSQNDQVSPTKFDPIVSIEDWYHAQYLLSKKSSMKRGSKRQVEHPLTGIIECSGYNKKYYIKPKANIYLHSQKTVCKCENLKSIPAKHTDELIFTIILDYLTRPELLKYRLRHHQMSWYSNHRKTKGNTTPITFPLSRRASDRAQQSLWEWESSSDKSHASFLRITKNICVQAHGMQSIHNDILPELRKYTRDAIRKWFTQSPKSARLDLVDDSVESIVLEGRRLIITFYQDLKISVDSAYYRNKDSYWTKRRDENSKLGGLKWETFEMADFISTHVHDLIKRLCHEEESAGLKVSNAIYEQFMSRGLIPTDTKFFFPISDFVCMENTSIVKEGQWSFRYGNQGIVFLEQDGAQETESAIHRNGELISFCVGNHTYINAKFLHGLPEWFYGHNYEYFLADKLRICFVEDNEKIRTMVLGRGGKKIEIEKEKAFEMILKSEKLKYVEIK